MAPPGAPPALPLITPSPGPPVVPLAGAAVAGVFVAFLFVSAGVVVLLWRVIEAEAAAERDEHPDWESAERAARRDVRADRRDGSRHDHRHRSEDRDRGSPDQDRRV